jgi:hypothetical protein
MSKNVDPQSVKRHKASPKATVLSRWLAIEEYANEFAVTAAANRFSVSRQRIHKMRQQLKAAKALQPPGIAEALISPQIRPRFLTTPPLAVPRCVPQHSIEEEGDTPLSRSLKV